LMKVFHAEPNIKSEFSKFKFWLTEKSDAKNLRWFHGSVKTKHSRFVLGTDSASSH
jgi:hypothetical protein